MLKTYTQLEGSKIPIKNCTAMLENHMQCWRAASFEVSDTDTTTDGPAFEPYQLCRYHAQIDLTQAPAKPSVEEGKIQTQDVAPVKTVETKKS
jgi:hypothetical protein